MLYPWHPPTGRPVRELKAIEPATRSQSKSLGMEKKKWGNITSAHEQMYIKKNVSYVQSEHSRSVWVATIAKISCW